MNDIAALPMTLRKERILSLIEYAQQSARLKSDAPLTVAQHNQFRAFEEDLQGLPGILFNPPVDEGSGDEIWLRVERLTETQLPSVADKQLGAWISPSTNPAVLPTLKKAVGAYDLVAAGSHRLKDKRTASEEEALLPEVEAGSLVLIDECGYKLQLESLLTSYLETKWKPWAAVEAQRRQTIGLYANLFALKHQLDGGVVDASVELVWGIGIGVWFLSPNCSTCYPLMSQTVDLTLNNATAAIEIRPRDTMPRLEIEVYTSLDNPGIPAIVKIAREFFMTVDSTLTPFDRSTFEPLLRAATTHLDPAGIFVPDVTQPGDRKLPRAGDKLQVTDTWVLFARPRTNSLFLQDLAILSERVEHVEGETGFPEAVAAVVDNPSSLSDERELPEYRGVSLCQTAGTKQQDLYFPKAFNAEQVRVVQLLDVHDGAVVQGPPGTGKTHTIANVICHYLAHGKRVLVTSYKDAPLKVLRDELPEEIRPLAISLLTTDQEGMRQFEFAIQKIATEVQVLDRSAVSREIAAIETSIESLHGQIARIDSEISKWAQVNLDPFILEGQSITPIEAAREIVEGEGHYEWIPDSIGISDDFAPRFRDQDISSLRTARRQLGVDMAYLGCSLPTLADFPPINALLQVHQDLSHLEHLRREAESGLVPSLRDNSPEALAAAESLLASTLSVRKTLDEQNSTPPPPWLATLRDRVKKKKINQAIDPLLDMFEQLGQEILEAVKGRHAYIAKPVQIQQGMEVDVDFGAAITNLAEGKSAFGLSSMFGRASAKKAVEQVLVLGRKPSSIDDWQHVRDYLSSLSKLRELGIRWNALAPEISLPPLEDLNPSAVITLAQDFTGYLRDKALATQQAKLARDAMDLLPHWDRASECVSNSAYLKDLTGFLHHHIARRRLSHVWATKEQLLKILDGRSGPIVDEMLSLLSTIGTTDLTAATLQEQWTSLLHELGRVNSQAQNLKLVRHVTDLIASSGAPKYAALLTIPLAGELDPALPDDWRKSWRLKRISIHLENIDGRQALKDLAKRRSDAERDLARGYQDLVIKSTWLKLAQNASPSVRSALQAYLNAIQKIGKGTGKKAARYRVDARKAATEANSAVPCWIMPHYRVSESLPAELGCFDLVIIDEASQSDLTALPALLRAKKVLVVGDDRQVSPEGVGLEEEKIRNLMSQYLSNQVPTYRPQMAPDRSIYDLFKVVFAQSTVMLREHFRCVGPIIEYSKREFYNHELRPLRLPKASERLDPPLIDVLVEDGVRTGDVNEPEIHYIVDEIKRIILDPAMAHRSIGVVTLHGTEQAQLALESIIAGVGPEIVHKHSIECGEAKTFQGKQKHVIFLTMVSAPNNVGAPASRDTFAKRYNVAASRARDRMYLVRSVDLDHLSAADILRRGLINHFTTPYSQDQERVQDLRLLCESPFEREVFDALTERGYHVTPQVRVGTYRIDLVVEGNNDCRLAIECDGDRYHGADKWQEDMQRQRVLERAGWVFWRCFASAFVRRKKDVMDDLLRHLWERGVEPIGANKTPRSVHTEFRKVFGCPTTNRADAA